MAVRHEAVVLGIERGTGLTSEPGGIGSDVLKARIAIFPPIGDLALSRVKAAVNKFNNSRIGSSEDTQNDRVRVLTAWNMPKAGLALEGKPGSNIDSVTNRDGEMVEGNVAVVHLRASGSYERSGAGERADFDAWYTRIAETAYPLAREVADVIEDAANFNIDRTAEQNYADRMNIALLPRPAGFES